MGLIKRNVKMSGANRTNTKMTVCTIPDHRRTAVLRWLHISVGSDF